MAKSRECPVVRCLMTYRSRMRQDFEEDSPLLVPPCKPGVGLSALMAWMSSWWPLALFGILCPFMPYMWRRLTALDASGALAIANLQHCQSSTSAAHPVLPESVVLFTPTAVVHEHTDAEGASWRYLLLRHPDGHCRKQASVKMLCAPETIFQDISGHVARWIWNGPAPVAELCHDGSLGEFCYSRDSEHCFPSADWDPPSYIQGPSMALLPTSTSGTWRVAVLGLLAGGVPAFLRARFPDVDIDVIEEDAQLLSAARTAYALDQGARLRVHHASPRMWLDMLPETLLFDAIYCYGFDSWDRPVRGMFGTSFFQVVSKHLAPHGRLVISAGTAQKYGDLALITANVRQAGFERTAEADSPQGERVFVGFKEQGGFSQFFSAKIGNTTRKGGAWNYFPRWHWIDDGQRPE